MRVTTSWKGVDTCTCVVSSSIGIGTNSCLGGPGIFLSHHTHKLNYQYTDLTKILGVPPIPMPISSHAHLLSPPLTAAHST